MNKIKWLICTVLSVSTALGKAPENFKAGGSDE